ncbi:MAG: hypothetical protein U9P63_02140, partial [Patescibacteria group bacterium]|nr:hypothetical protein [Patescibacteria group bacterium]
MKKFILDILFPIHCLGCGKEGKFICSRCLEQIPPSAKPIESDKQNGLKRVIAATDYENSFVKNIIYSYKYNFVRELSKPLGILMAKALTASLPFRPGPRAEKSFQLFCLFHRDCVLIPVPLHKKRLRWRGFNQSELLCQEIAKILNIAITGDILSRAKNTPPQAKIKNFFQRKTNIQNAFAL